MKILHTSDWHLGRYLYDFSLLDDQRDMLDRLLAEMERIRPDAVIIAGDIYDRPIPPAKAVELFDQFLSRAVRELGVPVLAVAGNHDSASRLEFGSSLYASSGYYISGTLKADLTPVTLSDRHGPVDFWLIPHFHPAELRAQLPESGARTCDEAFRALLEHNLPKIDPARRNVAVAHGFFSPLSVSGERRDLVTSDSEVSIGGVDIVDSACFAPFDYAALGHLHAPQRAGGDHIRYSGSPLKYSLSEERQRKSLTVLELGAKGSLAVETVPVLPTRDLRTIRGSLERLLDPATHENPNFDDYVFADLDDTGALYPMEKLRKLFPRLLGLRLLEQWGGEGEMPRVRVGGAMPRLSPEEMFRRFFRQMRGYDMPPESLSYLQEVIESAPAEEEVEP